MAEERDLKARLEIERGGDVDAFREAAEQIEQIAPAAEKADAALEGLSEKAKEVEAIAPAASKADAAFEKLVTAMDELAAAKGPKEQKAALLELARVYAETGREAAASFEKGSAEAEALTAVIEAVEARVRELGDGLEGSLGRAEHAWTKLEQSIESGSEGIQQRLVALQAAVREYAAELEEAERTGQEVTDAQKAKLEELNEAYRRGTVVAGEYRASQQQVARDLDRTTEAAGGQGRAIRSIDDLLGASGSKWSRYALNVGAVVGTFQAFYGIGTKLRDLLNEITDGGFDQGVQKWLGFNAIAEKLTGTLDEEAEALGRLTNNLRILKANGIDPAGLSAVELDRKVQELGKSMQKQRQEAGAAKRAQEEWAQSLKLSKPALDEEAALLAKRIQTFRQANEALSGSQVKNLFAEQIQGIVDEYARLGQEPPEAIRRLAAEWGVLTSAAATARDEHRRIVGQMRQDLVGAAGETKRELEALFRAIPEALAGVDLKALQLTDPEQFERAKQQIDEWLGKFREAGQVIPIELAKAATSVGFFVSQTEAAAGAATSIAAPTREAAAAFREQSDAAGAAAGGTRQFSVEQQAATERVAGFGAAVVTQSDEVRALLEKYGAGQSAAREFAAGQEEAAAAADAAGSAAGEAAENVADLGTETAAVGSDTTGIQTVTREFGLALEALELLVSGAAKLPEALRVAGASSTGWSVPIIQEMRQVAAEAAAMGAAVQAAIVPGAAGGAPGAAG